MKKIAILSLVHTPTIDAIKANLSEHSISVFNNAKDINDVFDLIIGINYPDDKNLHILNSHYSLLPAFDSEEPVRDAILSGVKVSGVTLYYTDTRQIIAQYPIFIKNEKHFDEIETEIKYLEQTLFPIVATKILNNEVCESSEILQNKQGNSCSGNCKSCGGCR